MRQFVGHMADGTLRDLLLAVAPPALAAAAAELDAAELAMMDADDEATQMRYAHAIAEWAEAGGYDLEVVWDVVAVSALGVPFAQAQYRELATLSGGEQKRIVLEALFRGPGRGPAARRARQLPRRARASSGSRSGCRRRPRPSCSSATTASCWPTPPTSS